MSRRSWPEWWDWELELSAHLLKRMDDRGFTEIELRVMLARAKRLRRDIVTGRWRVETTSRRRRRDVIVEPDPAATRLLVITAYPVWGT